MHKLIVPLIRTWSNLIGLEVHAYSSAAKRNFRHRFLLDKTAPTNSSLMHMQRFAPSIHTHPAHTTSALQVTHANVCIDTASPALHDQSDATQCLHAPLKLQREDTHANANTMRMLSNLHARPLAWGIRGNKRGNLARWRLITMVSQALAIVVTGTREMP